MKQATEYKNTPIGTIPIEWEVKKLGDIGVFFKGKGVPKSSIINEGYKCLTYGDLYSKYNYIIKNVKTFIDEETAKISQQIEYGDICFAGSGETSEEIGKCAAFIDDKLGYAGGDIIVFRSTQNHPITLAYFLNSENVQQAKSRLGQGNSIVHIYSSQLEKLQIPLPPLPEQQKIAEVLSTWDKAIQETDAIIKNLEQRNKALAFSLLTGKKRVKGFEGKWEQYKLENFFEEYSSKPDAKSNLPVFTSSKNGLMSQSDYYSGGRISTRENVDYNIIPKGFITYRSRSDDGLFTFNKNITGFDGLISGYYPVFKIVNGNDDFFLCYLNFFKSKLTKFSTGTSQLVLSFKSLKNAIFNLPSLEEQNAIAEILNTSNQEVKQYQGKSAFLKQQKKGLMQQLLTGKIRTV